MDVWINQLKDIPWVQPMDNPQYRATGWNTGTGAGRHGAGSTLRASPRGPAPALINGRLSGEYYHIDNKNLDRVMILPGQAT